MLKNVDFSRLGGGSEYERRCAIVDITYEAIICLITGYEHISLPPGSSILYLYPKVICDRMRVVVYNPNFAIVAEGTELPVLNPTSYKLKDFEKAIAHVTLQDCELT